MISRHFYLFWRTLDRRFVTAMHRCEEASEELDKQDTIENLELQDVWRREARFNPWPFWSTKSAVADYAERNAMRPRSIMYSRVVAGVPGTVG